MANVHTEETASLLRKESYRDVKCDGDIRDGVIRDDRTEVRTSLFIRSGTTTPNYRALLKAKAALPDNPLFVQKESRSNTTTKFSYVVGFGGCPNGFDILTRTWTVEMTCTPTTAYSGVATLTEDSAVAKLLSKAKGAEFSLPVFFGEGRETLTMILGTAKKLAGAYSSLRRGNLPKCRLLLGLGPPSKRQQNRFFRQFGNDARRAAANHWLELQYGWIPLLMDVKSAAELLASRSEGDKSMIGKVTSRTSSSRLEVSTVQFSSSPYGDMLRRAKIVESWKFAWKFERKDTDSLGSLGLLNPVSVAWELLPLSFVVDWMLPVGRYLEHLDVPLRFRHVGGTKGYKRQVTTSYSDFRYDGHPGSGSENSDYILIQRQPLSDIPSLGLNSITVEPDIGVRRFFSGMALASQAFKK
jgi:hypothetical protein